MKIFDKKGVEHATVEEALAAEQEYDAAAAKEKERKANLAKERKARAAEVEDAYKAILEARKAYEAKLNAFVKDYGSFHMTVTSGNENPFDLFDLFDFNKLWF